MARTCSDFSFEFGFCDVWARARARSPRFTCAWNRDSCTRSLVNGRWYLRGSFEFQNKYISRWIPLFYLFIPGVWSSRAVRCSTTKLFFRLFVSLFFKVLAIDQINKQTNEPYERNGKKEEQIDVSVNTDKPDKIGYSMHLGSNDERSRLYRSQTKPKQNKQC